jgi:hypothetical protein
LPLAQETLAQPWSTRTSSGITFSEFTFFYIARCQIGIPSANAAVDRCLAAFEVLTVDKALLLQARALPGNDFEDNVQISCALAAGLDLIVTRDASDFGQAGLPAMAPPAIARHLPQP